MILQCHSDASYLTAPKAQSRAGGHFFLGSLPIDGKFITLNGLIHSLCSILKFVAALAAEAELVALFLISKETRVMPITLTELGHPQWPTPIHVDNTTVVGIVNNTIKRQRSCAMGMRYFWLLDNDTQKYLSFHYQPGQENLGNLYMKAFNGKDTQKVTSFYVETKISPRTLVRAMTPKNRQGCVGNIPESYVSRNTLPILPRYKTQVMTSPAA